MPHPIQAHCKINLALAVAPPEAAGDQSGDRAGWHRIFTWMHCLELADTVELDAGGAHSVLWDDGDRIDWAIDDDLAVRAQRASAAERAVKLTKRVPAGGGLGGGSSDAAAVLQELAPERAVELGETLGSDIAFFIDDESPARPALVGGFGDEIERTRRRQAGVVLFIPPFGCPTPEVYRAFDADPGTEAGFQARCERIRAFTGDPLSRIEEQAEDFFNDLEAPACVVRPALGDMLASLRRGCPFPVRLTGSGSACFCLCPLGAEDDIAMHMAVKLDNPDLRVIPTRLA